MPGVLQGHAYDSAARALESDLPSLANQAAIELDNLVLKRPVQLDAVRRLASRISEAVVNVAEPGSPSSLLDVRTAVVINKAIVESTGPLNQTLAALLEKTKELTDKLLALDTDEMNAPEPAVEL